MCFIDPMNLHKAHMSPALNGSSAIRCFKGSTVIKICDRITSDFYTGLPFTVTDDLLTEINYATCIVWSSCEELQCQQLRERLFRTNQKHWK